MKKYKSVIRLKIISLQSSKSFEFGKYTQQLPNEYLNDVIIKMGLYEKSDIGKLPNESQKLAWSAF